MRTEDIIAVKELARVILKREPTTEELMEDAYWFGVFEQDVKNQIAARAAKEQL